MRKILYGSNDDRPKPKHFSLNRGQMYPEKMTLMDYRFDFAENWWPWLRSDDANIPAEMMITEIIVPTKETGFINNWLETCVNMGKPILIVGPTGTGKSATIIKYMKDLSKEKFSLNTVNFSARTTAQQVQELVMSKLDRRRKGVFGPPVGKSVCKNICISLLEVVYFFLNIFSARYLLMMSQWQHVMFMVHNLHWNLFDNG